MFTNSSASIKCSSIYLGAISTRAYHQKNTSKYILRNWLNYSGSDKYSVLYKVFFFVNIMYTVGYKSVSWEVADMATKHFHTV